MDSKLKIHYEDDYILVIEKPAGVPCLPAAGSKSQTLYDLLIKERPYLKKIREAGLVHRMDNDTSGLMVVAKRPDAYENLRKQFSNPPTPPFTKGGQGGFHVLKEYMALIVGNPPDKGTIATPIAHHSRKKKKMIVSKNGRPAETSFKVTKRFGKRYALLNVQIKTGVRHQIRVHLASIGFPIAGDRLYQNSKKHSEDTLPLKRHFLHASKLGFKHPKTNKWTQFSSALPEELKKSGA